MDTVSTTSTPKQTSRPQAQPNQGVPAYGQDSSVARTNQTSCAPNCPPRTRADPIVSTQTASARPPCHFLDFNASRHEDEGVRMGIRGPSNIATTPAMRLPRRSTNSVPLAICAAKDEGNFSDGVLLEMAASTSRRNDEKVDSETSATSRATDCEPQWAT